MSRFHDLGRRLATAADVEDDETGGDGATPTAPPPSKSKSKRKEDDMDEKEQAAAVSAARKEGHDAGFKAAIDRMNTVMASEHYTGREKQAATMLGKPAMSADDIVDVLADMPKVEKQELSAEEQRAAAEAAGRQEMRDAIAGGQNSSVDAGGSAAPGGDGKRNASETSALWDKAIAKVCPETRG